MIGIERTLKAVKNRKPDLLAVSTQIGRQILSRNLLIKTSPFCNKFTTCIFATLALANLDLCLFGYPTPTNALEWPQNSSI